MSKKKLAPRNPLVVEAKFKKAGLMEPTKKQKNKKNRALSKKELEKLMRFNMRFGRYVEHFWV
jgi:hypothetical protein